jgi:hypothetical protein
LRLDGARRSLNGDAKGDGLLFFVCCHCDVAVGVARGDGQCLKRERVRAAKGLVVRRTLSARVAADAVDVARTDVVRLEKVEMGSRQVWHEAQVMVSMVTAVRSSAASARKERHAVQLRARKEHW